MEFIKKWAAVFILAAGVISSSAIAQYKIEQNIKAIDKNTANISKANTNTEVDIDNAITLAEDDVKNAKLVADKQHEAIKKDIDKIEEKQEIRLLKIMKIIRKG